MKRRQYRQPSGRWAREPSLEECGLAWVCPRDGRIVLAEIGDGPFPTRTWPPCPKCGATRANHHDAPCTCLFCTAGESPDVSEPDGSHG